MKLRIYTSDKDNKIKDLSNVYDDACTRSIYISNNVNRLRLTTSSNTNPQNVKSVNIGKNVYTIGPGCFFNYTNLTCVYGTSGIKQIGNNSFQGCHSLVALPLMQYWKNYVGTRAFRDCYSLQLGEIHGYNGNVPEIRDEIYYGCSSMTSAYIEGYCTTGMFRNCSALEDCTITRLSGIPDYTFYGCTNLATINVETCEGEGCSEFNGVNLQDCISVGTQSFYGCTTLWEVLVSDSLTYIGVNAFQNCSHLTSINLQDSTITSLLNSFRNTGISCLELPSTLTQYSSFNENCLQSTNIQKLYLYGFTDDYLKENKSKNWKFGSSKLKYISSQSGKEYEVQSDGTLKVSGSTMVISIGLTKNASSAPLPGCALDMVSLKNMITQNTEVESEYYYELDDDGDNKGTSDKIVEVLNKAIEEQPSLLIFMFSDHGSDSGICTYKGDTYGSRVSYSLLAEKFGQIDGRVFAILECCHPWHGTPTISGKGKYLVWTTAKPDESGYDNPNRGGVFLYSAFYKNFTKGITYKNQWNLIEKKHSTSISPQTYNYNDFDEDDILFT